MTVRMTFSETGHEHQWSAWTYAGNQHYHRCTVRGCNEMVFKNHTVSDTTVYARWYVPVTVLPEEDYSTCDGGEDCPLWAFTDLDTHASYHDGVHFCLDKGIMEGCGDEIFGPNDTLFRAQLCQILYNKEGRPAVTGGSAFADVADGTWYCAAVTWAAENGIVGGYGDGKYGPGDPVTREQFAAILYRYAKYKGYDVSVGEDTNILSFTDAMEISEYAIPAMQWACGAGIMEGYDGAIASRDSATRAQAAAMLQRFCETAAK